MYKLLLIDDEPLIRKGLKIIVDWAAFNINICGEADNGIDGLRLCRELKPDIAIIDIRMPGMDGLKVIEEARSAGLECDFIVLSGYSEFTYAQKATEFGVRCYLLKPIEQQDLLKHIAQLRADWQKKSKEREQLHASVQLMSEHALHQFLQYGHTVKLQADDEVLLASYIGLSLQRYRIALIADETRELETEERDWIRYELQERYISQADGKVFSLGRFVGIVLKRNMRIPSAEGLSREAKRKFGLELVTAIGIEVSDLRGLSVSYHAAAICMKQKYFHTRKHGFLISPIEEKLGTSAVQPIAIDSLTEGLTMAIAAGNLPLISQLLAQTETAWLANGDSEKQIKLSLAAIYDDVVKSLNAADQRQQATLPALDEWITDIDVQVTFRRTVECLERRLVFLAEQRNKERKNGGFQQVLDYIAAHFGEDVKLESLAEQFHYNRSYLGKLFKLQTGESFNNYLDRIRMDQAKHLLAEGRKVYEVAESIGYAHVDYFHLKFRKIVGESPSAYRDKWKLSFKDSK